MLVTQVGIRGLTAHTYVQNEQYVPNLNIKSRPAGLKIHSRQSVGEVATCTQDLENDFSEIFGLYTLICTGT